MFTMTLSSPLSASLIQASPLTNSRENVINKYYNVALRIDFQFVILDQYNTNQPKA